MQRRSRVSSKRTRRQKPKTRKGRAAPTLRRRRSSADQADEVDIDDQRKAEAAVRESEYKLRQIIDTVPGIVWATGPDGENTYANQRLLDYIGAPHKDFRKRGWQQFIHPDDLPETLRAFHHALETGTSYETVHRVRRSDGEFRWHRDHGEPLRDREGRIIQWYGLSIDVDEAKKAEDRLRRSEAYLAEAQQLSHSGVAAYNETATLYGSEETYRIWGFDPAQGVPSREAVNQRIHPDDRNQLLAEVQRAVSEKRDYSAAYRIVLPDGTIKHIETIGRPAFSASGELIEIVTTQIDVTERKRAQEEHTRLLQLEADFAHMNRVSMLGEMAASLSHEIMQPIASARNNARAAQKFLEMEPPDLGEVREAVASFVSDTDRTGEIIARIREQIKKAPPRKERFDLNAAINEVIILARSATNRNGVSVEMRLAEGLSLVAGDRVQLQQVLLNLVLNAVEAMNEVEAGPRELSIRTEQGQMGVLVAVGDSGPGIEPDDRERVFKSFYTTKSGGTGMGLSICRSIIDAHGGRLWAEANEPRGAVFQFILPNVENS
jgi:PAS domain S-box-containing protein